MGDRQTLKSPKHGVVAEQHSTINARDIIQGEGHTIITFKKVVIVNPSDKTDNLEQPGSSGTHKTKEEVLLNLKEKLQQIYKNYTLPKVAWSDRGLDLSLDEYFVDLEMSDSNKQITIPDIFKAENERKPLRILIEGQPGYGKTTLALKLAFDWATDKEYIMDFKLVFFVPLRRLGRRSIADAIVEIGQCCNFENDDIVEMVNYHQNETLFILDGLDEILPETREEVMKTLFKRQYEKVTIVVFCRTESFSLSNEERTRLFAVSNVKDDFSDKRVFISGIENENKTSFLKRFFSKKTVAKIVKCVSLELDLFASPLFLMLLPILINDGKSQFSTKTNLYKQLFNCIVKHSCRNRGQPIENGFDLVRSDSTEIHPIQEMMRNFGKLCFEKLEKGIYVFESDKLTDEIYKIGFLAKQSELTLLESKIYYEAFHMSMMEFASACSLWLNYKFNACGISEAQLKSIIISHYESNQTRLTLPFLMGLFDDDLDYLLSRLQPLSYVFSFNFSFKIFLECSTSSIAKSNRIRHFIPSHIQLYNLDLTFSNYEPVYKQLLKCDRIKYVLIRIDDLSHYSEFLTQIPGRLIISANIVLRQLIVISKKSCDVDELRSHEMKENIESHLSFASSPNIEFCNFNIGLFYNYSKCMTILRGICSNKVFETLKFSHFKLSLKNDFEKNVIIQLVKNNQIRCLNFTNEGLETNDLILAAAESTYLTSIIIKYGKVDLYDLTNGGEEI